MDTRKQIEEETVRVLNQAIKYVKGEGHTPQTDNCDVIKEIAQTLRHCGINQINN